MLPGLTVCSYHNNVETQSWRLRNSTMLLLPTWWNLHLTYSCEAVMRVAELHCAQWKTCQSDFDCIDTPV